MTADTGNGVQRVAAFLLSLEQKAAEGVMRTMDPRLLSEVVEAMASLESSLLQADSLNSLYLELARGLNRPRTIRPKSAGELTEMLESTLGGEAAREVLGQIEARRKQERPFFSVESHPTRNIAIALERESDAVVALVVAHMDPSVSAAVLGFLDEERSAAVVRRMASLTPPPYDTLADVASSLETRLDEIAGEPAQFDQSRQLRTIAELLNFTEGPLEKTVLDAIGEQSEEMAEEIREFMFTWEDLAGVDGRSMQKILSSVDTKTLAMAVKACSPAVSETIMGNLSSRVREMVADERDIAGAVPMTEVEQARAEIMKAVRGLMESGEFRPAKSGEDLVT